MSRREKVEVVLGEAEGLEKRYYWIKAAELYELALRTIGKRDFSSAGEIRERIAYCLYRGAFQAETQEEFKSRMLEAAEAYEKAAEVYETVEHAKSLHCKAMALYANSWTLIDASRKKQVLDDCGELLKKALKTFEEVGDQSGYGKACNDLLFCLWDKWALEWDWTERKRCLEEAVMHSKNAISTLSKVGDERELARAFVIAAWHSLLAGFYISEEKKEEFIQAALSYAEKALEFSKKTGDGYLISWSNWLAVSTQTEFTGTFELSLRYAEEGLKQAKKTRDNFLTGGVFWEFSGLVYVIHWIMYAEEEDPDKKREGYERAIQHAEDAVCHLLIVCRYDLLPGVYLWYSESNNYLASEVETDPKKRRNLLERAIKVGREGLEHAEQSGTPNILLVHHGLSKALHSLSKIETQITKKRRLLEEALKHREDSITLAAQVRSPFDYWAIGVRQNYSALIKAELAIIETDKDKKRALLEEAVSHMEKCIELCTKWTTIYPYAAQFAAIGRYYGGFGDILNQLYSLTREEETLEKVVRVYQDCAETYRKAELPTRAAEAYWHAARLYDQLREHTKAERNFQSASENYRLASEKLPQLKEFYLDHAMYMQAWSEIENAKHHHAKRKYRQAEEHYKKAADLHKKTERWTYLSTNYLAWARLEGAEDLSRREQTEEAKDLFQQATNLFAEAKKSIQTKLERIEDRDERELLVSLVNASDTRLEYCLGRIALEEAKILDRQGDHAASSRKYGSASEKFQKAIDAVEQESDRQELRPIVDLSRAWQMMTKAEAEASPDLYLEASKLFEEAREHSLDEKAKVLALGHSGFCKALEAGARFEATRDMTVYSTAKKHLEAAANYYVRAGFKTASEYARATELLFDAYVYMDNAKKEMEPGKKAQYYRMAEKVLQASAGSYMKAKHPEKSEEIQRLLQSVKEEQQLAVSLTAVLHVPTTVSTTTSFSTPTPTQEQAVGLERFEHADVQATLLLRVKEANVGEEIGFRMELVNAGKAPALLIKVDEITPEGFEIEDVPAICAVEDNYLDLKGRRLNPLKTIDIGLTVKPQSKGTFSIKPRVLYIDETGKYRSHEPDPVTITVKELGIKGWIKGEK